MQLGLETWQIAGSCGGFTISTSARVAVRLRQTLCLYCEGTLGKFRNRHSAVGVGNGTWR